MRLIGRSRQRVDQKRVEWDHPFEFGERTDLRFYAPAWIERWYREAFCGADSDSFDASNADARRKEAAALKAEIEVRRMQRELVSVDGMAEEWRIVAGKIREGIEVIGRLSQESQDVMIAQLKEAEDLLTRKYGSNYKTNGDGCGKRRRKPKGKKGSV